MERRIAHIVIDNPHYVDAFYSVPADYDADAIIYDDLVWDNAIRHIDPAAIGAELDSQGFRFSGQQDRESISDMVATFVEVATFDADWRELVDAVCEYIPRACYTIRDATNEGFVVTVDIDARTVEEAIAAYLLGKTTADYDGETEAHLIIDGEHYYVKLNPVVF